MRAFIFPGQGSQAVGMGKALADASPTARAVFQEVDEALGQHLFRLMCDGPESELTLTENAQPAIMANAIATLRVLETEGGVRLSEKCNFVAGHSLGEYSALCAAGALPLSVTAALLKLRGRAMQAAVPVGIGAMAALRSFHVVEGKPTMSAQAMMARCLEHPSCKLFRVVRAKCSNELATVEVQRHGWSEPEVYTWGIEDAKRAGLASRPNWSKCPREMLINRCIAEAARFVWPEVMAGVYSPEEFGGAS